MSDITLPIIRLEEISKQFPGVQALDKVSLDIYPGEIHAIIGENGAGKSTLMHILAGEVRPDSGRILFMGEERQIPNPHVSQLLGISIVYQETALCPNLTAAENISLNTAPLQSPFAFVDRKSFSAKAEAILMRLGIENIDLSVPAGLFSIAQQQLVEIAKALSIESKVLILDEPNSALTNEETDHLFAILRQLRDAGVAIIYVSHRLEEVLNLAGRITVLRDGRLIDSLVASEATIDGLISKMVGRAVDFLQDHSGESAVRSEIAFEIRNLSTEEAFHGVSITVHQGEVVGVAGLPDSGKDELVECLFGLRPHEGEILIRGIEAAVTSPAAAIQRGLAFIPADRRGAGAMLVLSAQQNILASNLKAVSTFGFLRRRASRKLAQEYVGKLDIRLSRLTQQMGTLSGGNQQKVILARGLATRPSVLLLHEPTRGIDVGAKSEIYSILRNLTLEGVGVLIVSSELPELIAQCDRIFVMHAGRITGHFNREEAEEEPILACAMGQATYLEPTL
ncbi:MAG TPA: sugar ABC transporter ATP-binding protein [Anaerolineales bacterium]